MTQSTFKMAVLVEIVSNMLIRLIMLMSARAKVAQPTKLKLGTIPSYPNGLDIVNQKCTSFPLTASTICQCRLFSDLEMKTRNR